MTCPVSRFGCPGVSYCPRPWVDCEPKRAVATLERITRKQRAAREAETLLALSDAKQLIADKKTQKHIPDSETI